MEINEHEQHTKSLFVSLIQLGLLLILLMCEINYFET